MRSILGTLLLLASATTLSQELVLNGSFERHRTCPTRIGNRPARGVEHLKTVGGIPGYFHACGTTMGTPANWSGHQTPFDGEAYMGLVLTAHGGGECAVREFVQLELAEPLENGGKYLLSFHVSLADRSGYMTDRIGACFSAEDRTRKPGLAASFGKPDVDNMLNHFLGDSTGWMRVEGIYNARGGERYIQIGNFQLCDRTSRKAVTPNKGAGTLRNMKSKAQADMDPDRESGLRLRMAATQAYILLDAVSLVPLGHIGNVHTLSAAEACTTDPGVPPAASELVPDPSFDQNIPAHRSVWKNASGGTPDFEVGRTGIYLHSAVNKDHREYIHTPLKERLDPCGVYTVRLRVLRSGTYAYAVDRISVGLTEAFENDRRRGLLDIPLRWELKDKGIMDDTQTWTTLCGTINGGGCANRMVVGNFSSDDSTTIVQRDPQGGPFAYYFVDDISLWRTGTVEGCNTGCPDAIVAIPVDADTADVAHQWPLVLHFDVADHVPDEDLLPTVEELFQRLAAQPHLRIIVAGHTDATGNEQANMKLAKLRALAVRDELIQLGLPRERMVIEIMGSKEPIATNSTEAGRALNRRVEIRIPGLEN
ncbi:MAG: OmpA family protein [Flavobacteriales bacterium]|jgi:hypothetical protein|nr:OmpA family protein [Flavobacteriales bacterium]